MIVVLNFVLFNDWFDLVLFDDRDLGAIIAGIIAGSVFFYSSPFPKDPRDRFRKKQAKLDKKAMDMYNNTLPTDDAVNKNNVSRDSIDPNDYYDSSEVTEYNVTKGVYSFNVGLCVSFIVRIILSAF